MAPYENNPDFRKLKLNVHTASKPASSSFASIKQDERRPSPRQNGRSSTRKPPPSALTTSAFAAGPDASFPEHALSSGSDEQDLDMAFRERKTSISFNPEVILDGGQRASLEKPLPKPSQALDGETPARCIDIPIGKGHHPSHRAHSESDTSRYDNETGRLLDRRKPVVQGYKPAEMRHPLLQSTVDDLAKDREYADHERIASLTSGTTASPSLEEVRTPNESPANYLLSPLPLSSPVEVSSQRPTSAWPFGRGPGSQRSRSYNRLDKAGHTSVRRSSGRRNTTRSATSSMSPAGAFLSMWSKDEAISAIEPDDEGQEIGNHSEYIIGRQIGYGGFSVVKEVKTLVNGVEVQRAVKIVRKQLAGKSEHENEKLQTEFEHEVSIWRFLNHRYILPLIAVYDTPFATFCITHMNCGGTLFDLVRNNRKAGRRNLKPKIVKRYLYQLASAIRYLHEDVRVVHRDIKLENCLVNMSVPNAATEGGDVLLCDFGMADFITNEHRPSPEPCADNPHCNVGPSDTSTNVQGSLQYAAPELINAPYAIYSTAVDIWAYGVLAYVLTTGELPFQHSFQPKLVMMILKGEFDVELLRNCSAVKGSSEDAIDLVRGCLEMDPGMRWTIADILESPWLDGCRELYEDTDTAWS